MDDAQWEKLRRAERLDRLFDQIITPIAWLFAAIGGFGIARAAMDGRWVTAAFLVIVVALTVRIATWHPSSIKIDFGDDLPGGKS